MDRHIQYETSNDKRDWYKNHVLTIEERKKLIEDKIKKLEMYHKIYQKVKHI